MAAYLLIWNPRQSRPADLNDWLEASKQGLYPVDDWSTGSRKNLPRNSRVFLLRCGLEPKGIVASGYCTEKPHSNHEENDHAYYGEFVFTGVLDADQDEVLPLAMLQADSVFSNVTWVTQNCQELPEEVVPYLESEWQRTLSSLNKVELEYPPTSD